MLKVKNFTDFLLFSYITTLSLWTAVEHNKINKKDKSDCIVNGNSYKLFDAGICNICTQYMYTCRSVLFILTAILREIFNPEVPL